MYIHVCARIWVGFDALARSVDGAFVMHALDDLIIDAFRPIARNGAGHIEVQIRLQKCLASLAATAPRQAHLFEYAADQAHHRTHQALPEPEREELDRIRQRLWH